MKIFLTIITLLTSSYISVYAQFNDDCMNAKSLQVVSLDSIYAIAANPNHSAWVPTQNIIDATDSGLPVIVPDYPSAEDDLWFSFVASQNIATVVVYSDSFYDAVVEVYKGNCNNLYYLNGDDYAIESDFEVIDLGGLVVGQTYYVRIYDYYSNSAQGLGSFVPMLVYDDLCLNDANPLNVSIRANPIDSTFEAIVSGGYPPYIISFSDNRGNTFTESIIRGYVPTELVYLEVQDSDSCFRYVYGYMPQTPYINVQNLEKEAQIISLYPNPAQQIAYLDLFTNSTIDLQLEVINMAGQIVYSKTIQQEGQLQYALPVSDLVHGIYIVKVSSHSSMISQKLIISQ